MLHSVLHPQVHDNGVKKKNSVNQVHIATSCERYPFGRILSGARELENHNTVWRQIPAHLLLRSASTSDFCLVTWAWGPHVEPQRLWRLLLWVTSTVVFFFGWPPFGRLWSCVRNAASVLVSLRATGLKSRMPLCFECRKEGWRHPSTRSFWRWLTCQRAWIY